MTEFQLLALLSVATLVTSVGFGLWSERAAEREIDDRSARKSPITND